MFLSLSLPHPTSSLSLKSIFKKANQKKTWEKTEENKVPMGHFEWPLEMLNPA